VPARHEWVHREAEGEPAAGRLFLRSSGARRSRDLAKPDQWKALHADNNIKSRHTANTVLKQAGIPKAF